MKKKIQTISLIFISAIIITSIFIVGCSDMPYAGSMLTVEDVDRYLISTGEDTFCLQNGHDSACLTLTPRKQVTNAPCHPHPSKKTHLHILS